MDQAAEGIPASAPAAFGVTSDGTQGPAIVLARAASERVCEAAEVLRGQLRRPGRYHQGRDRGIAERLMGVEFGAAQDRALDVWGRLYGATSGTLHGGAADRPGPPA
ncbi:hypothetical protein [Streptomyces sp. NPDC027717]|uniref:hypothetical protein n=1 Tax=Streptomyces sp. NPDC027717 TaxID=3155765 RepID=UPI00340A0EAA